MGPRGPGHLGEVSEELHREGEDLGLRLPFRESLANELEGHRRNGHAGEVAEDGRKTPLHARLRDATNFAPAQAHFGFDQRVGLEGSAKTLLAAAGAASEDGDLAVALG